MTSRQTTAQQLTAQDVAARVLASPARLGQVRLVCVDGPAGSGKTTFAGVLSTELRARVGTDSRDRRLLRAGAAGDDSVHAPVVVLHLDDLYEGWGGLEGSLWPRLDAQVLDPLRRGLPGRYQRYDWPSSRFAEWQPVPVPQVLVLEGCGSARRATGPVSTLRVWVQAPRDLRLARGLARDGMQAREHWLAWMRDEAVHFAAQDTRRRADVRLDAWGTMPT